MKTHLLLSLPKLREKVFQKMASSLSLGCSIGSSFSYVAWRIWPSYRSFHAKKKVTFGRFTSGHCYNLKFEFEDTNGNRQLQNDHSATLDTCSAC